MSGARRQSNVFGAGDRRASALAARKMSIDPRKLVQMDKTEQLKGAGDFNVLFIGAGNIMFGSDEGPWNHSFRLEHKLGPRLKVVALIDPAVERAKQTLAKKCETFVKSAYENTKVFSNLDGFIASMTPNTTPKAVVIGSPPMFRGTTLKGRDIEVQIMKAFPGIAMFIEKPIATGPDTEIDECFKVSKLVQETNSVCSVGYMLRYLKAVQEIKRTIEENNLTVMATIARYACAYEAIAKPDWWDKEKSAGPVIEQGTHFCDLSRYFGGDVDINTVQAHSLEWNEAPGKLSAQTIDEFKIPEANRIPRVTSATWKYENGAVGTFTHLVALQGHDYACEFQVYADGYSFRLVDPYVQPILYVRKPGDDHEVVSRYANDDPFFSEISNFIDTAEDIEFDPESPNLLSSYEDACRSYELTWAIRHASERSRDTANKPAA